LVGTGTSSLFSTGCPGVAGACSGSFLALVECALLLLLLLGALQKCISENEKGWKDVEKERKMLNIKKINLRFAWWFSKGRNRRLPPLIRILTMVTITVSGLCVLTAIAT
jgi:hypothetical protein